MKNPSPEFCDFDCPHADFPPADTAGLCRTMSAVWCKKLRELVSKNAPCEWRHRQENKRTSRCKAPRRKSSKRAAPKR